MNYKKSEINDALKFYNQIEKLHTDGIEVISEDISIGNFLANKGDDVDEQYELMLDYFQERGMNLEENYEL